MLSILVLGFVRRTKRYIFFFPKHQTASPFGFKGFGFDCRCLKGQPSSVVCLFALAVSYSTGLAFRFFFFLKVQACDSTIQDKNKRDDLGCQPSSCPPTPEKGEIDTMEQTQTAAMDTGITHSNIKKNLM